jgi:predicted RNase H-like nuclease (RuvC/YqgF family)
MDDKEIFLLDDEEDNNSLLSETEDALTDSDDLLKSAPEVDPVEEANESLRTSYADPFNLMKEVNSTLSQIEKKIDQDHNKLKKLDQLEDIKNELIKMNEVKELSSIEDQSDDTPSHGDNLPDNSELLIKIEYLQNKIREIENENKERFEKIESTVERFEEIEKELEVEYVDEEQTQEHDLGNQISPAQNTSNEEVSNFKETSKPKNNLLLLLLIFLIILVSGAFILDTLGIVNLYLAQTLKTLF